MSFVMSGILLRSRRSLSSALLTVALLSGSSVALGQTDEQRAGARTLATEGALAFNEGRFKDAVDLFSRAESLVHAPPHLLFIARAQAKLGQFVKARESYLKIVREQLAPGAPQAFRDARASADEERKQVEPRIGRLLVKVEGGEAAKDLAVSIDGQPIPTVLLGVPQPMDPGEHVINASATGFKSSPVKVSLKDGGTGSVVLKLEADGSAPPPSPLSGPVAAESTPAVSTAASGAPPVDGGPVKSHNGMRIGSYVALGVGAAGLAAGTFFVLSSASKRKDADAAAKELPMTCGTPCLKSDPAASAVAGLDDDARRAKVIGIVGYVVGGVGVATGVTLFVLSSKQQERAAASGFVAPYIGLNSFGVRGAF